MAVFAAEVSGAKIAKRVMQTIQTQTMAEVPVACRLRIMLLKGFMRLAPHDDY